VNEQIKTLAKVAGYDEINKAAMKLTGFDPEKFAELIVAECVEQVITGPNGPAHYAVEAALRLKKHFGVEQ
jgi:hypothetical protein